MMLAILYASQESVLRFLLFKTISNQSWGIRSTVSKIRSRRPAD